MADGGKKAQNERAREADLIILPKSIEGTNCGNCMYMQHDTGECLHKAVHQQVKSNWCCIYWDAEGVQRVAKKLL